MDTLRRRIPFKLADDNDDNNDNLILDEERTESLDILPPGPDVQFLLQNKML